MGKLQGQVNLTNVQILQKSSNEGKIIILYYPYTSFLLSDYKKKTSSFPTIYQIRTTCCLAVGDIPVNKVDTISAMKLTL